MSVKQEANLLFCVVKEIVSAKTAFGDNVEKLGEKMAVELSETASDTYGIDDFGWEEGVE